MGYHFPPDVDRLVKQQMASGQYASEDELLASALRALESRKTEFAAVSQAIDDMEAGDTGRGVREVAAEIRSKHGWSHG